MRRAPPRSGSGPANAFTLAEVLVAIVILAVGLLGLASTGALVARMTARGQRAADAALFARQRLEQLRAAGCAERADGSESLVRGGVALATNVWTWRADRDSGGRLLLVTRSVTAPHRWRADTTEMAISCRR